MFRIRLKITRKKMLKHPTEASTRNLLKTFLKQADEQSRAPFFPAQTFSREKNDNIWSCSSAEKRRSRGQTGRWGSLNCQRSGTTIPLPFHLQGTCEELTKGFTPRHYFRHNIRPVHTIKQWQHLNSHSTSIYPVSLHNEFEEKGRFSFLFFLDNFGEGQGNSWK